MHRIQSAGSGRGATDREPPGRHPSGSSIEFPPGRQTTCPTVPRRPAGCGQVSPAPLSRPAIAEPEIGIQHGIRHRATIAEKVNEQGVGKDLRKKSSARPTCQFDQQARATGGHRLLQDPRQALFDMGPDVTGQQVAARAAEPATMMLPEGPGLIGLEFPSRQPIEQRYVEESS